ncbi:MAG TPA: DUF488 domain-containing protein [Terracidiphilus sp.]
MASPALFTIGHSTHSIEEFVALLKAHGVEHLVDVRSIPRSRHCPQFNSDVLEASLESAGIGYTALKALGGRRHARKDSVNAAWRNASFRGYADYMGTEAFAEGLEELIAIALRRRTAIMCAEAVPWRCHRSLIADAMVLRGWEVLEIVSAQPAKLHKITSFLKVVNGEITYPLEEPEQGTLPL